MNSYSTTHLLTRKPLPLLDTSLFIQAVARSRGNENRTQDECTCLHLSGKVLLSYQCNIFKDVKCSVRRRLNTAGY